MEQTFSISDLAREFDITPRTIRYYEAEGLISPTRKGQRRIYSGRDRVRLALVMRGKRLGFSLAEAKEIIDLYTAPQGEAFQLRTLMEKLDEKRAILGDKRRDLDTAISNMDKYAARCRDRLTELESRKAAAE